jgi:XTP/dITP diphosphohydrolase
VSPPQRIVVASENRAKAAEIAEILAGEGLAMEVLSLADFPGVSLPPETGSTFAANAAVKARQAAQATELAAIADDSGLEIDALDGEPGVRSARYAGEDATDEDRYRKVLDLLADVPDHRRRARFRCAAAFAEAGGKVMLAEGTCQGRIAKQAAGSGGFGYDPVFIPDGYSVTMAQLTPAQKHRISHRGRAFRLLAQMVREHLAGASEADID